MHSTIFTLTTLLALTTALTLPKRYESHPESIALSSGVCGPLQTPLCCQIDVLGVIDLTCENGMLAPPLSFTFFLLSIFIVVSSSV
jgi:hypothetical protein